MVFLKNQFSRRYSNLKFEKFDSVQANTSWSQIFLPSQPLKKLTKKVGLCCNSSKIFLKFFSFFIHGKERPAKTKLFPAKLCALLVTFGFPENLIVDSAQCQPAQSPTPRSVSMRRVRLPAVLACTESDSPQCQPAQSPTPQKQTFKQNHFSLFIRGTDGLDS